MTKGTIRNNKTGLEIHGELIDSGSYLDFEIDGATSLNSFLEYEWTFTEDNPTLYEQYVALPVGTRFNLDNDRWSRVKLDDKTYAKAPSDREYGWEVYPAELIGPGTSITVID